MPEGETPSVSPSEKLLNIEEHLDKQLFFYDGTFKAPLCAGHIIYDMFDTETWEGINRGILVTEDSKEIYRYNGGYYENDGEEFLKRKLQKLLGTDLVTRRKNEVINWIKDNTDLHIDRDKLDQNPEIILLENCAYNIVKNEIAETDPQLLKTTCFPIRYNPEAKCPQWKHFLQEVAYKEDIPVIQEMFGYCFYKPYIFQKAFMFVGEGANGKGVTLNVLSDMLGKKNISTAPLQRLCNNSFSITNLFGKYANICADISSRLLKDPALFKTLTGGDIIHGEIKHKQGEVKFRNTAKAIFSCNVIPECPDKTYAYHRRWIVFEYPNRFPEGSDERDPFLAEKLKQEIPGIFNWAMEGLRRLLNQGHFSNHRTLEDVKEFMKEQQDPVVQFINNCVKPGEHKDTYSKKYAYNRYKEFCDSFGLPIVAQRQFTSKMKQYGPHSMTTGQTRKLGHCFHGLKIVDVEKGEVEEESGGVGVDYEKLDVNGEG